MYIEVNRCSEEMRLVDIKLLFLNQTVIEGTSAFFYAPLSRKKKFKPIRFLQRNRESCFLFCVINWMEDFERRIGYHFRNQAHLRRALTCQSAINERHPQASDKNYELLEFLGDAVLKYIITTLVYNESLFKGALHESVCSHISNEKLTRIGRGLNLERYIIKGRGVSEITDNMFANTVEAILGAIVVDQRQQGNNPETILPGVIARLFSIPANGGLMMYSPRSNNKRRCSCYILICVIFLFLIVGIVAIFIVDRDEL